MVSVLDSCLNFRRQILNDNNFNAIRFTLETELKLFIEDMPKLFSSKVCFDVIVKLFN